MPVFLPILVPSQIEQAVANTLATWMPTYLREIERQMELPIGELPPPLRYTNRATYTDLAARDLPFGAIISPGLAGAPRGKGGGLYSATWQLGVAIATAAAEESEANLRSKIYGAAAREVILDHGNLDGSIPGIANINWLNETYTDLPIDNALEEFKAAQLFFNVDIDNAAHKWDGPKTPDDEPYAYGTVDKVVIDIIKRAVNA